MLQRRAAKKQCVTARGALGGMGGKTWRV